MSVLPVSKPDALRTLQELKHWELSAFLALPLCRQMPAAKARQLHACALSEEAFAAAIATSQARERTSSSGEPAASERNEVAQTPPRQAMRFIMSHHGCVHRTEDGVRPACGKRLAGFKPVSSDPADWGGMFSVCTPTCFAQPGCSPWKGQAANPF